MKRELRKYRQKEEPIFYITLSRGHERVYLTKREWF